MCGIVGYASIRPSAQRDWLLAARDTLVHRGPDQAGIWWSTDSQVGFGHRRLSIIDLSEAGRQPMMDADGLLSIVFNGEIYNYLELKTELSRMGCKFRSKSDTEVILEAYRIWGSDCVAKLKGMFAFAIADLRRRVIFAARDRAGEKPLFYSVVDGALYFASEIKAIVSIPGIPRKLDLEAMDCYLALGFVPGRRAILKGIQKLPPAHTLEFDFNTGLARERRYWEPPILSVEPVKDDSELVEELDSLLGDAVRRQLVADVPVGVLLSGGVDSSIVTALAARSSGRIKTFTVRFAEHAKYDESPHARLIARHFGTDHIELESSEIEPEILLSLARQFDEPVIDSSMIPTYLVSKLVRGHCTVALGGDGGDELFGGYSHYNRLLWLEARASWIPRSLRKALAEAAEVALPVGFKGRNWLGAASFDFAREVPLIASYFDRKSRRGALIGLSLPLTAARIRAADLPAEGDLLQRATRADFRHYLAEDILVKVDRASMLCSLEMRAPFLDVDVMEFAFRRVPSRLKASTAQRKILLKRLAQRLLPDDFDRQRKQGFSIPLAEWLKKGKWRDFFEDVLLGSEAGIVSRDLVLDMLNGQSRGRSNSERLFALVLFELWRREYRVNI